MSKKYEERKFVSIQSKVSPSTVKRLDAVVERGKSESKYELLQYLISVFLKFADPENEDDTQFASLFMPDAWEMDGDSIGDPSVWKKCNPHIGVTVQLGYYEQWWNKAQRSAETMLEFKGEKSIKTDASPALRATDYKAPHCVWENSANYRIRKLTPKECFRLMGVSEGDIEKIQNSGVSQSQQYKMAGNSIVVDVLEHIFRKMFVDTGQESQQLLLF